MEHCDSIISHNMASAAPEQKRAKMASPVDEIVEVTQCDPALAQAVLDNVTDDVSSPVSCALQFSRQV